MRRIAAGDADALAVLYRREHAGVRALCTRMTGSEDVGEDLAQEVFVRAVRGAASFRGEASASTWLYRIARNVCLDRLRRDRREATMMVELGGADRVPDPAAADGAVEVDGRSAVVEAGLRCLSVEDREVVVLAACVGLGSMRLADVLECTPGAARVRLHRALVRLRRLCRDHEEETDGLRAGA